MAFTFYVAKNRFEYERGHVHGPFSGADHLISSSDGSHFAFVCVKNGKIVDNNGYREYRGNHFINLDSREYPAHNGCTIAFRSDGRLEMKYHPSRDGGGYGEETTEVVPPF